MTRVGSATSGAERVAGAAKALDAVGVAAAAREGLEEEHGKEPEQEVANRWNSSIA